MSSDEVLEDPALRQAYDHFGHSAVVLVRHNKYASDSLYRNLSTLHDDGKSSEALGLLQIVLEDAKQKKRQKEWEFNADVEVNMHACTSNEVPGSVEWPEVSSTNVSLTASVPMPTQSTASPFPAQSPGNNQTLQQKQKMQLSIGGQSSLENGMGSTRGMLSANYQPVAHTNISSDLVVGHKHLETSLSSSTQLTNGTGLSAKMTRQYALGSGEEGKLAFAFSSDRGLTIFHRRTVHAMFALGVGSNLKMQYGVLSLTTWGFSLSEQNESDPPPPRISAKFTLGAQFPVECAIDQSHLFDSPHRSGRASVAWSPLQGYKLKGLLSRNISKRCGDHESEFASKVGIGVEHTGLSGFKWLISYQRPEGLTVRIPIFVSSFLSPGYWNRVLVVSTLSYLLDETIEEWMGHSSPSLMDSKSDASKIHKTISAKIRTNQKARRSLSSSKAKRDAEQQLCMITPVANMKRQREESINGLVILKATYAKNVVTLDVTQQLQFWVENSRLYLPPSSKKGLMGFYDLSGRDNHAPDQLVMSKVKRGKTDNNLSSLSDRLVCTMNIWLSRLGVGGEDAPHQSYYNQKDNRSNDNDDSGESVILTVRYKYKGQVFELSTRDDDVLELPSSDATILGPSDRVS